MVQFNHMMSLRYFAVLGVCTVLAAAVGCGKSAPPPVVYKGQVHGKVTLNGQPVPEGSIISFFPDIDSGQRAASATVEKEGKYKATGVPVGKLKVTVAPAAKPTGTRTVDATPTTAPTQGFPEKYLSVSSTDAEVTVPEGDVEYNLDMQ